MWTCPSSGQPACALGQLGTVITIDEATALANRDRLDAEDAAHAEAMARAREWWERTKRK